jgi:hypothetical protein
MAAMMASPVLILEEVTAMGQLVSCQVNKVATAHAVNASNAHHPEHPHHHLHFPRLVEMPLLPPSTRAKF